MQMPRCEGVSCVGTHDLEPVCWHVCTCAHDCVHVRPRDAVCLASHTWTRAVSRIANWHGAAAAAARLGAGEAGRTGHKFWVARIRGVDGEWVRLRRINIDVKEQRAARVDDARAADGRGRLRLAAA